MIFSYCMYIPEHFILFSFPVICKQTFYVVWELLFLIVFKLSFNDLMSTPLQFLKCKYLVQLAFWQYAREYRRLNANAIIMTKALCHIRNIGRTHTWKFCNSLHLLHLMQDLWFNTYCNNVVYAIILRNKFKLERDHDIKIDERMGLNKCIINLEILYDNNFNCLLKWKHLLTNHDTYLINSDHSSIYHTRSQLKEGVYFSINTPIIVSAWSLKPIIVRSVTLIRCSLLLFFIYGVYIISLSVTQNLVTYFYRLKSQAAQLALNKAKVLVIYYYSILIVFFKHFDVEALGGFSLFDLALEWVILGNLKIKIFYNLVRIEFVMPLLFMQFGLIFAQLFWEIYLSLPILSCWKIICI